jgi:glyoxylase-like metal-dependent hydrolase (beta-lactamase superfamily II)
MTTDFEAGFGQSGKPRRIAEGVYSISQKKGGRVHAYLLDDGEELTLIDTLFDNDAGRVLAAIKEIGREVSDLKNIIATHAHRSHIGGVAALRKLSGGKVWSHEWEADIIAGERQAQRVSLVPKRPLRVYYIQVGLAIGVDGHVPCEVDGFLREGDRIGPLQVIHMPGHSPGHTGFYWKKRSAVFAGDALATWPYLSLGWDGLTTNIKQHRRSLHKLDDLHADIICVGHGEAAEGDNVDKLMKMVRTVRI